MRQLFVVSLAAALVAGPVLAATAEQLQKAEGSFRLSNGVVLNAHVLGYRLYAELKNARFEWDRAAMVASAQCGDKPGVRSAGPDPSPWAAARA